MQGERGGECLDETPEKTGSAAPRPQRSSANLYLTVAAPIFFGLFFVEYPPLFLVGYWSWGGLVHKVLSGIFLLLNLGVAEMAVRRSRSKIAGAKAGDANAGDASRGMALRRR